MTSPLPESQTSTSRSGVSEDNNNGLTPEQRRIVIIAGIAVVIGLVALIGAGYFLVSNPSIASAVRDVFIILMALEFTVIGVALVILMVQLAILTNMLQHEIRPILESTNETVNTVRGTTVFLSENLVEPVIKLNAYLAALSQVVETLGMFGRFGRKK